MIGVGKLHWVAPPLPPNRTGGSPASGSPVDSYWRADWYSRARVVVILNSPCSAKKLVGYSLLSDKWAPRPRPLRRRRRMLRIRIRTHPSTSGKVVGQLCLKYWYQPRIVRFRSAMIELRLRPLLRRVLARIVSLNFAMLFDWGNRRRLINR